VALFIGIHDMILYDEPFASVMAYVKYNVDHVYDYPNGPPTRSLWVILGYLVPPISLLLAFGFARSWRIEPMLFAGSLAFFLFHAFWPNKQERFLFTVMPMIVVLGTVGWYQYAATRKLPDWLNKVIKGSWVFFWSMNVFVAVFLVFTNNKKDRVEPIAWLRDKDVQAVAVVQPDPQDPMIPVFYLGKPAMEYRRLFYREVGASKVLADSSYRTTDLAFFYALRPGWTREKLDQMIHDTTKEPQYVIVRGTADEIERGYRDISQVYPSLSLEKVVEPSTYDRILFFLNPEHNPIKRVNIYKIN
jgi:hypothetical protein